MATTLNIHMRFGIPIGDGGAVRETDEKTKMIVIRRHLFSHRQRQSGKPKSRFKAINFSVFLASGSGGGAAESYIIVRRLRLLGRKTKENLNKYVIYSGHKTFKAFYKWAERTNENAV